MNEIANNEPKLHPFEAAGMDHGPYRWAGLYSLPSPEMYEKNTDAANAALREIHSIGLVSGAGTCSCCGMAIVNIHVIVAATGRKFGVGCDCAEKTGDPAIANKAKVAAARLAAAKRRVAAERRRLEKHIRWLDTVCNDAGETNRARLAREQKEREEAEAARKGNASAKWGWLIDFLAGQSGGFCSSIREGLQAGAVPSGRAVDILADIWGKAHGGRVGSKAFEAAYEDFFKRFDAARG